MNSIDEVLAAINKIIKEYIEKKSTEYELEVIKWQIVESITLEGLKEIEERSKLLSEEGQEEIRGLIKEKEKKIKENI